MTEPWLTKREVAAELRCSVRTVERLHLPCMRVGGQNRYYLSRVRAFLNGEPLPPVEFPEAIKPPQDDHLYFVREHATGLIKIGRSRDPKARARGLQTAVPAQVELLRVLEGEGPREVEFHNRFAAHRVRGEWFEPCPELLELVEGLPA